MYQRRLWVLLHRWISIVILLFVVVAGLTGSAIAFWRNIDAYLNPSWYSVEVNGVSRTYAELSADVIRQYPESRIHGIVLPNDRASSVIIYLAEETTGLDEIFINPYSGDILGARSNDQISFDRQHLMPLLYRVHYSLAAGGIGEVVLGVAALLWLMVTLIGLWLAWPKRGKWHKALSVKTSAGLPRLMFDLHRAVGLLFGGLFLVIIWTGLWWNMNYAIRPVVSSLLPTTPWFVDTLPEQTTQSIIGPDEAIALALAERPEAKAYYLRSISDKSVHIIYLRQPGEAEPYGRTFVFVSFDGTILNIDEPAKNLVGDSYSEWQLSLHTGQFLGFSGRLLWAFSGLLPALLAVTGLVLWTRRRNLARVRQRR
ncbi:PepSY-associated TM helix domain-containing protein [Methylophaga sp.]|uniref:PepSY-associated TM helix domain-containing protein n=1 Tax=Methylophaga sp. TaxID=2024840 RepID=UPI003A922C18